MNAFGNKQFEIYEFNADWNNPSNSTYQLGVSLNPAISIPRFTEFLSQAQAQR